MREGHFNGWARIGELIEYKEAAANFCILLTIIESIGYTIILVLGIIGLIQIGTVRFKLNS